MHEHKKSAFLTRSAASSLRSATGQVMSLAVLNMFPGPVFGFGLELPVVVVCGWAMRVWVAVHKSVCVYTQLLTHKTNPQTTVRTEHPDQLRLLRLPHAQQGEGRAHGLVVRHAQPQALHLLL